nr:MAG TPA: hypothetical protein [Bacteriophage sp.]
MRGCQVIVVRDIITFKLGCTLYYHIVHVQD